MRRFVWAMEKLNGLVKWICIGASGGVFLLAMAQIVFRYLLKISAPWTEEAARYLMIWMALLAAGLAFQKGEHFNFDIIASRLKPRSQSILGLLTNFLAFLFLLCPVIWGIPQAKLGFFTLSPGLQITMFLPYLALPVGGAIMVLNLWFHSYTLYKQMSQEEEQKER